MDNHKHTIEAVYPLSPAQEGILFHTSLSTDTGVYFIQRLCTLSRDLDLAQFKEAWQQVVQRHAILRTAFLFESVERPFQVVGRHVQLPWQESDWRAIAPDAEQAELDALLLADRTRGFELTQAPLMRCHVLHRQNGSYYFLWSFHHAILDGWSWPLVLKEVYTVYNGSRQGVQVQLPAVHSYQSYIAWLQQQDLSAAEQFWRSYLRGITAPTFLSELRGEEIQSATYARCQISLPPSVRDTLQAFLQRSHLTVNTVSLGAWALLLSRYSGESEVILGTAVSGRPPALPGVTEMVGMFINTLPARVRIVETQSTLAWLQALQQQQAEMRQYEYSPLARVQKWSDVPRGTALFEHILVCNAASATDDVRYEHVLETEAVRFIESTNYPLEINIEAGEPFIVQAVYEVHHFQECMIQQLLAHLQTLVQQMCEYPERRLGEIDLFSTTERRRLLVEWNATEQKYPANRCIHQLFEAQATRSPTATALVYRDMSYTYQELDQKANQLASYLRKRGVGPEVLVGVCLERSLEMLVGVSGVLKAGGAYIPLDPYYPIERLAFILADAACPFVLTQESLIERFPGYEDRAICLDRDWSEIEQESTARPDQWGEPANLAYVIYTSGSTGRPKGVQITHRSLVNCLWSLHHSLDISATDRWLAITTIAFDIAALELFLPLMVGARITLASHEEMIDSEQLARLLYTTDATVLQATPATWRMLLDGGWQGRPDLKMISGGEALTPDLAFQLLPKGHVLWNLYGPTETTIWSTAAQITPVDAISLGHPIANTRLYILDSALRPVPVGVEGLLYIGGAGLARGYLNRPELTAERFLPDPFGAKPGARLYYTGDRVRYRADGSVEFLGRVDYQVKLRGFRIELGEIETTLCLHPRIRGAVVMAHEDSSAHKRLVAYIVETAGEAGQQPLSAQEVQQFLHTRLPEYMVPSLIIALQALPLTPNGKVDRRALPDPASAAQQETSGYVEPRSQLERQLAQIWQQILHVERIGIHDSFFELGGDSILSVRVVARARREGIHLTARDLFRHQTIAQLVHARGQIAQPQKQRQEAREMVPLTPMQRWFFERHLPDHNHWNQSFLFRVQGSLDPALLRSSLQRLSETHDALRLRFQQEAGEWKQWIASPESEGNDLPLGLFVCAEVGEEERVTWMEECIVTLQSSLRLDTGPLWRVAFFDAGPGQPQHLLFIVHHLAVDITSWRILLHDWQRIYQQLQVNIPIQLPPVPASFRLWAAQLERYTHSLQLMRERDYWLGRSWDQAQPIPRDAVYDGENSEKHAKMRSCLLSEQETHILLREVSRVYHMLVHEVLLAALAEMYARWTGSPTLLVDLEGHGREDIIAEIDLSRTVGWCTTLVPLCLHIGQRRTIKELLNAVKEQVRAMPHGGIGYGLLRYCGRDQEVRRRLAGLPRREILFHYRGRSATLLNNDAFLVPAQDVSALALHPASPRSHLLAFEGQMIDDRLRIAITYSEQCFSTAMIEQLLAWYREALREIIAHCQIEQEEHFTPQDFPEADLDQAELDDVITSLYEEMES